MLESKRLERSLIIHLFALQGSTHYGTRPIVAWAHGGNTGV